MANNNVDNKSNSCTQCSDHSAIKLSIEHLSNELKRIESKVEHMEIELMQSRKSTIPLPVTVAFISFFGVVVSVLSNVIIAVAQIVAKAYGV